MKCFILLAIFIILNVCICYSITCEEAKKILGIEYDGNCCDLQQINCDANNEEILSIENLVDEDYVENGKKLYRRKGGGHGGGGHGGGHSSGGGRSSGGGHSSSSGKVSSSGKSSSNFGKSSSGSSKISGSSSSSSKNKYSSYGYGSYGYGYHYGYYGTYYHSNRYRNKISSDCTFDKTKENNREYREAYRKKCCYPKDSSKELVSRNTKYNEYCNGAISLKSSALWIAAAMVVIQLLL